MTERFERDFWKLDSLLKQRLDSTIQSLENDPHLGKPLRGDLLGKWSLRIGEYRIIYTINDEFKMVTLYRVRHRKVAYR